MKFTNILVPFDKSDHALHALTLAKGLAEEDPAIKLPIFFQQFQGIPIY